MTTITSYPKNIPVLSWKLGAGNAHSSSIQYTLCEIINCQYTGMTSANILENGAKRKAPSMFHMYCKKPLYSFFSYSTYFHVPQPKKNKHLPSQDVK